MIIFQANHIEKQFDGHVVLRDVSLVVQDRERIGLIGANGAGKSTFLRIALGEIEPDGGVVSLAKNTSVGYVAQYVITDETISVFSFVAESFQDLYELERRMRALEQAMATPEVYEDTRRFEAVSAEYDSLQQQFEDAGGYAIEARIRRVLDGLRFPPEMHQLPVQALSGGQKTRLSLARLLAWQPQLLMLDEPTNYLDTDTLTWLEGYLKGYEGAVLLVSHDRYFLDAVATGIVELEDGRTTRYEGNYSDYMEQKANREAAELKQYELQQKEIQRLETFVQKNIVRASTTKRAQSRRKLLEKMTRLEKPNANTPKMAVRFTPRRMSGKDVLFIEDLVVGYGAVRTAGPIRLNVHSGMRIAIVGPNGIGKTTLLNTLVGRLPALSGHIRFGHHVDLAYYDQEQEDLDDSKTVFRQIHDEHPDFDIYAVRTALARYLFRNNDVDRPVAALSGGERSRLSLCRLMLTGANLLLMDEPTNHLDLLAKEVLEDALADFEGTLIFVSHDRYFIDALATHVLAIDEHGARLYIGNYSDYLEKRMQEMAVQDQVEQAVRDWPRQLLDDTQPAIQRARVNVRKLEREIAALEEQIAALEKRQGEIEEALVSAATDQNVSRGRELQVEAESITAEHTRLLNLWQEKAELLEETEE